MKLLAILWGFLVFCPMISVAEERYTLGPGDTIQITVYGEEELSQEVILTESGNFSYPFLGEIQAEGLTLAELEAVLLKGLTPDYLLKPTLTVVLTAYRQFYVLGEVNNPGAYSFRPGLTLRQAIALAGGLTERGTESRATVIIAGSSSDQEKSVKPDDRINPGDTVQINQRYF